MTEAADKYDEVMDMFMRFLWQVPSNRAWVVNNAKRMDEANLGTSLGGIAPDGDWNWDWTSIDPV